MASVRFDALSTPMASATRARISVSWLSLIQSARYTALTYSLEASPPSGGGALQRHTAAESGALVPTPEGCGLKRTRILRRGFETSQPAPAIASVLAPSPLPLAYATFRTTAILEAL